MEFICCAAEPGSVTPNSVLQPGAPPDFMTPVFAMSRISDVANHPDALPGYQVLCEVYWESEAFDRADALLESCPEELQNSSAYVLLRGETLSLAQEGPLTDL